jgi:hypothetical protein
MQDVQRWSRGRLARFEHSGLAVEAFLGVVGAVLAVGRLCARPMPLASVLQHQELASGSALCGLP